MPPALELIAARAMAGCRLCGGAAIAVGDSPRTDCAIAVGDNAAAPPATLGFVLWTMVPGLGLLLPSLWLLFAVFKGRIPGEAADYGD